MSSEFPGGYPDFFNRNNNINPYSSPLAGILAGNGKRSLAEYQQQQQLQHAARVYFRNVKAKPCNQYSISPESCLPVISNQIARVCEKNMPVNLEKENMIRNQLQKLEKELLLDDDEDGENDVVSVVTDCEISETIQNLLAPIKTEDGVVSVVNHSPTTSFSSCATSSANSAKAVCYKELISAAATAIMDGKTDAAVEILTRLNQVSNARGTPEQRLTFYMTSALKALVCHAPVTKQSSPVSELYCKEHVLSTQLLYDKSPCFKLAFMAANNTILEAVSGSGQPEKKLHVVDFDIGQGVQYVYLLHEIAAARESARYSGKLNHISLKLTTFADFGNGGVERLKLVGDGLKLLSNKLSVSFSFNVLKFNLADLRNDVVLVEEGEILAVNFAFKLYRLPDESVTVDNLRDEVLRRVKGLKPSLVTVVEQEMNANTASFTTRVNEAGAYYKALFESLDSTFQSDNSDRVRIEEGLSRRIVNSVACEGRDRVERCEVFGKWQARMRMAGLKPKPLCQLSVELLLSKLNSGTRVNRGFTVKEYSDGISFGWMGRNLTVASAWH